MCLIVLILLYEIWLLIYLVSQIKLSVTRGRQSSSWKYPYGQLASLSSTLAASCLPMARSVFTSPATAVLSRFLASQKFRIASVGLAWAPKKLISLLTPNLTARVRQSSEFGGSNKWHNDCLTSIGILKGETAPLFPLLLLLWLLLLRADFATSENAASFSVTKWHILESTFTLVQELGSSGPETATHFQTPDPQPPSTRSHWRTWTLSRPGPPTCGIERTTGFFRWAVRWNGPTMTVGVIITWVWSSCGRRYSSATTEIQISSERPGSIAPGGTVRATVDRGMLIRAPLSVTRVQAIWDKSAQRGIAKFGGSPPLLPLKHESILSLLRSNESVGECLVCIILMGCS